MPQNYIEYFIKTPDKVKIALNHYKKNKDEILIIAAGWTMSKNSLFIQEIAKDFSEEFDVISFDFRGHGKSSGLYTFTVEEQKDLKTIIDYAKKDYKKVYLIGFSLGGAISIIYNSTGNNVDNLIIVSAPHSFETIKHFGWLKDFIKNPFNKYEIKQWIKLRISPLIKKKVKPIEVVDKIKIPTLFIAGESDNIIPPEDTKKLFEKAACKKHFKLFENCNHAEDLIYQNKKDLLSTSIKWFKENIATE